MRGASSGEDHDRTMRELPTIEDPVPVLDLPPEQIAELTEEVRTLAAERDAVILAHNYQVPEVQDVADYVGDSLGLSRKAAEVDAGVIAFCGVHFMAETASVLSPGKTVLLPDLEAGCSLSDSITANELRNWKSRHPGAITVMYVNTSAEVKAETDYCCTSSNAVAVVEHILRKHGSEAKILFGPDVWLGSYIERVTGHPMEVWPGECHVHAGILPGEIDRARSERPDAALLIHPECRDGTRYLDGLATGDIEPGRLHMLSTGQMLDHVRAHPDGEYIIATETGMLYPIHEAAPRARLTPANDKAVCKYMKMITLPKLRDSLREMKHEVRVPAEIAERARLPIERMVAIG
jgi:quinolinate synthase